MTRMYALFFGLMALLPTSLASAAILNFSTTLNGTNEVPANASPASGTAQLTWDTVSQMLLVEINFTGLQGTTTAAHIHCCAPAGANAAVAVGLTGFPVGVNSGLYSNVFDLTDSGIYNGGFLAANGNAAGAEAALFNAFSTATAYINIHTNTLPGGEIRGQIAAQLPEPATVLLLSLGLLGFAMCNSRFRPARA